MLDLKMIRQDLEQVRLGLQNKQAEVDLDRLVALDSDRRKLLNEVQLLKTRRNQNSADISKMKKEGKDVSQAIQDGKRLGEQIKEIQIRLNELESSLHDTLIAVPNLPHQSSPVGKTSADNVVVREWGEKPDFNFEIKDHLEIGQNLSLFNFSQGAKITGRGFPVFTGLGAKLERSLINFFLDTHIHKNGFEEVIPPLMVSRASMTGTGQLPKMENDMYRLEEDDLFLIPTAEVPVTNLHAGEIIPSKKLPISYVAYTPCFRREAGSWGKETRGFQRLHQFDKVEMVKFVQPEVSYEVLEELVSYAEQLLQELGLHYRVMELCSGDLSFAAAKCYDLEVYSPATKTWLEVSSVSTFEDFQARRANIRTKSNGKPRFLHTLNGSGLATPRVLVALLESYQTKEGNLLIPEVLQPYMDGLKEIKSDKIPSS
jgi:seryl-tRNA synthetase